MTAVTSDQDETAQALSRRKMFAMCSLGVLGAAGLAACSSDSTSTADPAAATTTAGSDGASAGATAGAGTDAESLVKLADVPVAGGVSLEVAGKPVIVSQPTEGDVVAFSAVCPHQFATVAISGKEIRCPLHGSTFDLATGKNLTGPAAGQPLPPYAVKVVDGEVVQA
jgi:cytochrome b6-f complex iron-sulfur subunit